MRAPGQDGGGGMYERAGFAETSFPAMRADLDDIGSVPAAGPSPRVAP